MIVTENVNLIKSIPSQYFLEVERIVFEAIANGNKIDELKSELLKRYAITNRRAKLIAKDQIKKATEMLERRQLIDAGVTKGFWLHSGNYKPGRARKSHVEAAQRAKRGEWYDLRKGMLIDGRFTHPKELVNCNCTRKIYAELRQLSRFAVDKNIRMAA
ncbi:hypothetical protein AAG570_014069 [Ranatra chinensis]|uniref:Uncharacterized protein n=1 Tax=Ranatra chinensis TaxID=642074 RepID=A0ABD0YG61_9HEMI